MARLQYYGPVYGILDRKGKGLFVADELDGVYQYFDLEHDPFGLKSVLSEDELRHYRPLLRAHVQHIADMNHFQYRAPTLVDWLMR